MNEAKLVYLTTPNYFTALIHAVYASCHVLLHNISHYLATVMDNINTITYNNNNITIVSTKIMKTLLCYPKKKT